MKKFSNFLKRTIFLVLPAVFAFTLSLGHLSNVAPSYADESSSVSSDYDIENDIYTIRKTGDHSIELLFNANPRVYKNFRKHHLTELKDALIEILKDIVHTKITDLSKDEVDPETEDVDGTGGDYESIPEATYTGGGAFSEALVHDVHEYVSLKTYADMLTNYCSIGEGGVTGDPVLTRITSAVVVAYAHFWVKGQILRNDWPESEKENVYHDFCVILAQRLHSAFGVEKQDVYSQVYGAGSVILDTSYAVTLTQVTGLLNIILGKSTTGSDSLGVRDLLDTVSYVVPGSDPEVYIQNVRDEILSLVSNADAGSLRTFFKETPLSVIQSIEREIDFSGSDLDKILEDVGIGTFIDIASDIGVYKTQQIIGALVDFRDYKSDFISKVTEMTTARDVWKAIENIHIDDVEVMKEKQFIWDGLVELFSHFPPMSELKNYADNQWRHEFHVVLDTAVDEVVLDVNLGFKGNCKYLRKAADIIDRHLKIRQDGDHFEVEIDMPNFLANMYRYLCEADFFDDDLKHELWDLAFSTVDEAYQHVHQKTIADLMANAEQIDYKVLAESIVSADEIKEFFGISRFVTQERVDKFIDLVFKAINKGSTFDMERVYELVDEFYEIPADLKDQIDRVYEKVAKLLKKIAKRNYDAEFIHDYLSSHTSEEFNEKVENKIDHFLENAKVQKYYNRFQRLLEKVYAKVPQKYRTKSLMDFYQGDSVWSGSGDAHFNIKKIVRKIPKIGPKLADFLSAFFDRFPDYFSLDLKFTGRDLYRISYHVGNEVKTGALPIDTEATFWANRNSITVDEHEYGIVAWGEKTGENSYAHLTDMPARDVDAYPVYFTTSANISKPYDGLEATLEVTPNIEIAKDYEYVWYKDGVKVDGATEASLTVKNHSDSGTYYCEVNGVKLDEIVVSIDQVEVEFPTQTETIVWDGNSHDYYTSFGATSEDNLLYHGGGAVSEIEPGEYEVNLELKDTDNYVWSSYPGPFTWAISKKTITVTSSDLVWSDVGPFTYNGEEQSVELNGTKLPQGVHAEYTGNTGTNAGNYHAVATIVADDPAHYEVIGVTEASLDWTINKAHITVPGTVGLVQDEFSYDGSEHTVEINEAELPAGITGVNYSGTQKATEMGEYTVSVTYSYDEANYILDDYQHDFSWTITPRIIDISNVTWDYTGAFTFDEKAHSVSVINLPTDVKVEYSGTVKATARGTYLANAKLYTIPSCKLNYKGEIVDTKLLQLEWQIVGGTPVPVRSEFYSVEQNESGTSLVWMSLSQGVKGNYSLHAEEVDPSQYDFNKIVKTGYVDVVTVYNIDLYNDDDGTKVHLNVDATGKVIDPNFTFTVRILVPETHKDHELVLTYANENGEVSRLDGTRQGDYMVFTTNHLSVYGLVETHVAGSNATPYIVMAIVGAAALQATGGWILIILAKRKRRNVKDN